MSVRLSMHVDMHVCMTYIAGNRVSLCDVESAAVSILSHVCRCLVGENSVLRKLFGPLRDGVQATGGNSTVRNFMVCIPHQIL